MKVTKVLSIIWIFLLTGCKEDLAEKHAERAYYFWKTSYQPDTAEQKLLDVSKTDKLYIRYFDVIWNEQGSVPQPVSPIHFYQLPEQKIIPVIFITNQTMMNVTMNDIPGLAADIINKVTAINSRNSIAVQEMQIDCDWTVKSKTRYFYLLSEMKKILGNDINLTVTIRLHQVKFSKQTGVPPVQRGTLMVYNMSKLHDFKTRNSIFDADITALYTDHLKEYPLLLDLAFPIYRQGVLFRNKHFTGVFRDINAFDPIQYKEYFVHEKNNLFRSIKDTIIQNIFIKKGDIIRLEQPDYREVKRIASKLKNQIKNDTFTLILFDLNSRHYNNISTDEIKALFSEQ